jgi:hypothetical protein
MASAFALLAQFLATVMIAALLDRATHPMSRHCVPHCRVLYDSLSFVLMLAANVLISTLRLTWAASNFQADFD